MEMQLRAVHLFFEKLNTKKDGLKMDICDFWKILHLFLFP